MKTLTAQEIQAVLREKIPPGLIVPEHTATAHFYRHTPTEQRFASVTTKGGILDAPHLKKWAAGLAADYVLERVPELYEGTIEVYDNIRKAAINAHQTIFEDAGDIGTIGHGFVDEYLQEWMQTGVKPADILKFVKHEDARTFAIARSAELFMQKWRVMPIASELLVASLKYKFAGTLDALMMVTRVTEPGNGNCEEQMTIDNKPAEHDYWSVSVSKPHKLRCMNCGQKAEEEFALVDWKTSNSIDKVEYAMQTSAYWQGIYELTGLKPKNIYIVRLDKKMAKFEVRKVVNRSAAFRGFTYCVKLYDWLNDGQDKLISMDQRERVSLASMLSAPAEAPAIAFTAV